MSGERCYLLMITGYDPVALITKTLYFGTSGFVSGPLDTPANQYFEPRISNPGVFSQSMYAIGTTGGQSQGGFGAIELINIDKQLDTYIDWGFDGNTCIVMEGPRNGTLKEFVTIIKGTVEQSEFTWYSVTFRFKDNTLLLDRPVALEFYLGYNIAPDGLEGDIQLKGKEKPRLFGTQFNFEPVCVNTSKLIYQISSGAITAITDVRDNGVPIEANSVRSLADLQGPTGTNTFTVDIGVSTTIAVSTNHGCTTGDIIHVFSTLAVPEPLLTSTPYYVRAVDANSLSFHWTAADATANTAAITFLTDGTGTNSIIKQLVSPITTAGMYDWCFDALGSYIRLGSALAGKLTVDAYVDGTIAQTLKSLAQEKTALEDVVVNGQFDSNAWWTKTGAACTLGTSQAPGVSWTASTVGFMISKTGIGIVVGGKYKVRFTVTAISGVSAAVAFTCGTATPVGTPRTEMGIYEEIITATADGIGLVHSAGAGATIKVNDLSVFAYPVAYSVVEQSVIDLDKTITSAVKWGHYTGQRGQTTKAVMDALCKAGIWWGFDNLGLFWVRQFKAPLSTNAIITFTDIEMSSVERVATNDTDRGVPVWKVVCRYRHNNSVQTGLLTSATEQELIDYATEWKTVSYQDSSILAVHKLAQTLTIDTPFDNATDALAEATRQFGLRSVRRDRLQVAISNVANGPLSYSDGGYWDDLAISELPVARAYHKLAVHNNYLYVIGGVTKNYVYYFDGFNGTWQWGYQNQRTDSVLRLDLSNPTGLWETYTSLPTTLSPAGAVVYNNFLYVLGGRAALDQLDSTVTQKTYRLDLSNPLASWDDAGVTDLPDARYNMAFAIHSNYLYMAGGTITSTNTASVQRLNLNSPSDAWDDAGVSDLPSGITQHRMFAVGDKLYLPAGRRTGWSPLLTFDAMNCLVASAGQTSWIMAHASWAFTIYGLTAINGTDLGCYFNQTSLDIGQTIDITYTYTLVSGTLKVMMGATAGAVRSAPGTFTVTESLVFSGTPDRIYFSGGGTFNGSISFVDIHITSIGTKENHTMLTLDGLNPTNAWVRELEILPVNMAVYYGCVSGTDIYLLGGDRYTVSNGSTTNNGFKDTLKYNTLTKVWSREQIVGTLPTLYSEVESNNNSIYYTSGYGQAQGVYFAKTSRLRVNSNPEDKSQLSSIGREIIVKMSRYGYTAGRPMTIIGSTTDHKAKQIKLDLWG